MSELRKAKTEHPYFLTLSVVGWIDVFTRERYCDMVIDSLKYCIKDKGLKVYAYVIMTNHIHLIARQVDSKLNYVLRDLKSHLSRTIIDSIKNEPGESRKDWLLHMFRYYAKFKKQNPKHMFWQKTNHPTMLDYPEIFYNKLEYIHLNPVRAGYVTAPDYWNFSSANVFSPLKVEDL